MSLAHEASASPALLMEDARISREIDRQIEEDRLVMERTIKLLLLGTYHLDVSDPSASGLGWSRGGELWGVRHGFFFGVGVSFPKRSGFGVASFSATGFGLGASFLESRMRSVLKAGDCGAGFYLSLLLLGASKDKTCKLCLLLLSWTRKGFRLCIWRITFGGLVHHCKLKRSCGVPIVSYFQYVADRWRGLLDV